MEDYLPDGFKTLEGLLKIVKEKGFHKWLSGKLPNERIEEIDSFLFKILNANQVEKAKLVKA